VDGWDSLLTHLPGVGGYGALGLVLAIAVRMALGSDKRHRDEVAAHEATQEALDRERTRRREAEDAYSEVKAEVRELRTQVAKLEALLQQVVAS
jgi:hypothetical protein